MERRALLVALGAVGVGSAGCISAGGGNVLRLGRVESLTSHVVTPVADLTTDQRLVVEAAHADGAAITYGYRPVQDGTYLRVDGNYYRARVDRTGSDRRDRDVLVATAVSEPDGAVEPDALSTLPQDEREPAVHAVRLALARERDPDTEIPEGYVFRGPQDGSRWLPTPDPEYVQHDDTVYRLHVETRTIEEHEYTTTLEYIADSDRGFEAAVNDELVVDFDVHGLSDDQREIIEAAIADEYRERGRISPAFNDLVNLLQTEAAHPDSLIKYEDAYYEWEYWHSD